jgi:hypothetical protein
MKKSCIAPNSKFIRFLLERQNSSYIIVVNNNQYLEIQEFSMPINYF